MATIGDQIRTAREAQRPPWSREFLAEQAGSGMTVRVIEGIETGRTIKPSVMDVWSLCHALGLDMAEVVGKAQRGGAA